MENIQCNLVVHLLLPDEVHVWSISCSSEKLSRSLTNQSLLSSSRRRGRDMAVERLASIFFAAGTSWGFDERSGVTNGRVVFDRCAMLAVFACFFLRISNQTKYLASLSYVVTAAISCWCEQLKNLQNSYASFDRKLRESDDPIFSCPHQCC